MITSAKKLTINNLLLSSVTDLTLSDRRLFNYLLHHAFKNLPKKLNFAITLTALKGVYGTDLPPIDHLKESLRRLMRTLIEFETHAGAWIITSLLERAELNEQKATLSYSYPLQARELFINPFTLERCLIQAHFNQKYSNLLYEILSQAHHANQKNISLEITDLRNHLQIKNSKFSNYSDLDRFVLTPATDEINSYASFAIKFHTLRKGMKVTHVTFDITFKKNIFSIADAQQVIPPKRPRLFIDNPELERAYAYLLNTSTKQRRKYFDLAINHAAKKKITIPEVTFDQPDLWFKWVEAELLKPKL